MNQHEPANDEVRRNIEFAEAMDEDPNMGFNPRWRKKHLEKRVFGVDDSEVVNPVTRHKTSEEGLKSDDSSDPSIVNCELTTSQSQPNTL